MANIIFRLKRGYSLRLFMLSIIFLSAGPCGLFAAESWPPGSDWVAMRNNDWENYQNIWTSGGLRTIDMVPDADNEIAYFASTSTSLFFRMTLQETPVSGGSIDRGSWFIALDRDMDNYFDWLVQLAGQSQFLYTFPNSNAYPDNEPDGTPNYSVENPVTAGNVRIVPAGTAEFPDAVYLDIQVPFSALQTGGYEKNVTYASPFAMTYATNNNESVKFRDVLGNASTFDGALAQAMVYTPNMPRSFARIYDTRDPAPYSGAGIWYRNEPLAVSGYRWPTSASPYYNSGLRNVRIVNSGDSIVWSGVLSTSPEGEVADVPLWTIGSAVTFGSYTLRVEHPRRPGEYYDYDRFEVKTPLLSVEKTTSAPQVGSGSDVSYTVRIGNSGNVSGNITNIVDNLPEGFSYVAGSASGLTTADPLINGNQLNWKGNWTVPVGSFITLNFEATASLVRGEYPNYITVSGGNIGVINTGPAAPVRVTAPQLSLSKSVDMSSAAPGDTLIYSVTYINEGDGDASHVFVLENIPANTEYVTNSAEGTDMEIKYSHDGGIIYDSDQTAPVTNLSFQRTSILPPGTEDSIIFKVIIK